MTPGIYETLSFAEYTQAKGVNHSYLKWFDISPAKAEYMAAAPRKQTDEMLIGTVADLGILEPEKMEAAVYVTEKCDRRTKEGKALAEKQREQANGRLCIPEDLYERVLGICGAVVESKAASSLLLNTTRRGCSVFWEEDGLLCKARPDAWSSSTVVDLKTTSDATPAAFAKTIATRRYATQLAWYRRGLRANGVGIKDCCIVAVENLPPYGVASYHILEDVIALAEQRCLRWLAQFRECAEKMEFPGYPDVIQDLGIPAWAYENMQEVES